MKFAELANPGRFLAPAERSLPWLWGAAAVLAAAGLFLAFFVSPPDYQRGDRVRVLSLHVPSAWWSMAASA